MFLLGRVINVSSVAGLYGYPGTSLVKQWFSSSMLKQNKLACLSLESISA